MENLRRENFNMKKELMVRVAEGEKVAGERGKLEAEVSGW